MLHNNIKIDIIIPVYNNTELTICCIKSVYEHLGKYINKVIIHDDCSEKETYIALNKLNGVHYNNLEIIRSEQNIGFAAGVNKANDHATSNYIFILNSDTEILADIMAPMLEILVNDPNIACMNPSGPVFSQKKLNRCNLTTLNVTDKLYYVKSANSSGYALLIKRDIFNEIGGFNTIYGRGYYEDTELSRVLINKGYNIVIYPTNNIRHVGQSSFNLIQTKTQYNNPKDSKNSKKTSFTKSLISRNKAIYLQRFPKATQVVDIYTLKTNFNALSENIKQKIINITLDGGIVTIHGLFQPKNLPLFQIKYKKIKIRDLYKLLVKRYKKEPAV